MKWMRYDQNKRELTFKVEDHGAYLGMEFILEINGPMIKDGVKVETSFGCGCAEMNSTGILSFNIPEEVQLHMGSYTFILFNRNPKVEKGTYILATGFSHGTYLVCHQGTSIRI